jgi:hypothetical protein
MSKKTFYTDPSQWKKAILINLSDKPVELIYYDISREAQSVIYVDNMEEALEFMQKVQDEIDMDDADHMGEQ